MFEICLGRMKMSVVDDNSQVALETVKYWIASKAQLGSKLVLTWDFLV